MRLKDSQTIEVYMSSWAKEKGEGILGFKGKEDNHRKMGKQMFDKK